MHVGRWTLDTLDTLDVVGRRWTSFDVVGRWTSLDVVGRYMLDIGTFDVGRWTLDVGGVGRGTLEALDVGRWMLGVERQTFYVVRCTFGLSNGRTLDVRMFDG